MKKLMSVICTLALVCALVPWNALQVQAVDPVEGLTEPVTVVNGLLKADGKTYFCNENREVAQDAKPMTDEQKKTITHLFIDKAVETIGENAFKECKALTAVDFSLAENLTTIGEDAFSYSGITEVDLSNRTKLETIGKGAFFDCKSLTTATFSGCTALKKNENKEQSSFLFGGCSKLKSANFTNCTLLSSLGAHMFSNCDALETVSFSGCQALNTIKQSAFDNCSALQTVSFSGCQALKTIQSSAFHTCPALQTVDFSDSTALTSVSGTAFNNCSPSAKVYVPAGKAGLFKDKVGNDQVIEGKPVYALYKGGKTYACDITGEEPDETKEITDKNTINHLFIDGAVTEIGQDAFKECKALTTVNLSGCTALTTIGQGAFWGCNALKTVNFSGCTNLQTISRDGFNNCDALTTVDLSDCVKLETIGQGAFMHCYGLTTVDLSPCTALTTIANQAFERCEKLTTVNLSGCTALTTIGEAAFNRCPLTTVSVPEGKADLFQGNVGDAQIIEGGSTPVPTDGLFQLKDGAISLAEGKTPPEGKITFVIAKFDTNNALTACEVVTAPEGNTCTPKITDYDKVFILNGDAYAFLQTLTK